MLKSNKGMVQVSSIVLLSLSLISCAGVDSVDGVSSEGGSKNNTSPKARVELTSQSPAKNNRFGEPMAFSADGKTLVIGESNGDTATVIDAGIVQIFTKSNGNWAGTPIQTLTSQTPSRSQGFGTSFAISQDSAALAIAGSLINTVDVYTKSDTRWIYSQTISLNGITPYGTVVAFHPNNRLLAIGASTARIKGVKDTGAVQLFTKTDSTWVFAQQLTSQVPTLNNRFGSDIKFSPDGSTLAVNEIHGDTSTTLDVGKVHLFTSSGGSWSLNQILVSNEPTSKYYFGGAGTGDFDFSPDSNTIAIREGLSKNVQLFTRNGKKWLPAQVIAAENRDSKFGRGTSFSADGKILAIGESSSESNGMESAGKVYLFTQSGANWVVDRTLSAQVPTKSNLFGFSLVFSLVGNELAVYELSGDTSTAENAGVVSIINLSLLP